MRKKYIRVGFTPAQSSELWDRWQKGEGLKSIGRALGKPSSCMFNHLRPSGGIRPADRTRSRLSLTLVEREEISRGLALGQSLRSIAGWLNRGYPDKPGWHVSHETIYRSLLVQAPWGMGVGL